MCGNYDSSKLAAKVVWVSFQNGRNSRMKQIYGAIMFSKRRKGGVKWSLNDEVKRIRNKMERNRNLTKDRKMEISMEEETFQYNSNCTFYRNVERSRIKKKFGPLPEHFFTFTLFSEHFLRVSIQGMIVQEIDIYKSRYSWWFPSNSVIFAVFQVSLCGILPFCQDLFPNS